MGVGREGEEVSGHRKRTGMAAGPPEKVSGPRAFHLGLPESCTDVPSHYPLLSLRHLLLHG